jgi:hypothetical protein
MPTMKPNFDAALDLSHHGTRVEAKGPLHWNDTKSKCEIKVTIVQGPITAEVKATGTSNEYDTSKKEWDADARTEGAQFAPGTASAMGVVKLRDKNEPQPEPWVQQVELRSSGN